MANIFEKNKSYLGDCLELMPKMESGMFDMILCDLPYGTTKCKWDTIIPFDALWKEYKRLIKPNGAIVLFGSEPFSSSLRLSNIKQYRYDWIWKKNRPANINCGKIRPLKYFETISVFSIKKENYYPQMIYREHRGVEQRQKSKTINNVSFKSLNSVDKIASYDFERYDANTKYPSNILEFNVVDPKSKFKTEHTTQKPVELFEHLIRTYTNEGETVLDNCAGSGTTGEACYNTGRNYIQIEKEQKYFDLILGREKSFNKKVDEPQTSLWNTANGI